MVLNSESNVPVGTTPEVAISISNQSLITEAPTGRYGSVEVTQAPPQAETVEHPSANYHMIWKAAVGATCVLTTGALCAVSAPVCFAFCGINSTAASLGTAIGGVFGCGVPASGAASLAGDALHKYHIAKEAEQAQARAFFEELNRREVEQGQQALMY